MRRNRTNVVQFVVKHLAKHFNRYPTALLIGNLISFGGSPGELKSIKPNRLRFFMVCSAPPNPIGLSGPQTSRVIKKSQMFG